ncbi:MAG: hypothetical protein COX20_07975 [Desulfobacterales bacterium CG23_combo_of_CG06-09_8_20_14_all_52_9]|nr:MAG: hypothetical protein COX20_07975 [Desulfobacterales bacterium CG23_combo_of_CG06-09_8_20_14_all_52_9]
MGFFHFFSPPKKARCLFVKKSKKNAYIPLGVVDVPVCMAIFGHKVTHGIVRRISCPFNRYCLSCQHNFSTKIF